MKKILICGNPDLNYIDGSSIWSQTIALVTAATGVASVDFLAKSKPNRPELFEPLKQASNVSIINGTAERFWKGKRHARLTPSMMAEIATVLDRQNNYDVIIVRGLEIATSLLNAQDVLSKAWLYLTDIPQEIVGYSPSLRNTMNKLATKSQRILCQTQGFSDLWKAVVPTLDKEKVFLYSPVIPDIPPSLPPVEARALRPIYAGKFKEDWMTLEMVQGWPSIHEKIAESELIVIGDKIHTSDSMPDYPHRMRTALEATPGVTWIGSLSREEVQNELRKARVGLSWRAENMNDTIEYSTKILEYGGAGCATILNRNALHENLLGADYPLFANSQQEFFEKLHLSLTDLDTLKRAASKLRELAEKHTFSAKVGEMTSWLENTPKAPAQRAVTSVLVAGHDLKFFNLIQKKLEQTGKFKFIVDQWSGHNNHDEKRSHELLHQADVIFCEWSLGNLVWYSNNKLPHQKLITRFHAQEVRVPYFGNATWDNIDHVIFVSEHTRKQALEVFNGFPFNKTSIIGNYLDTDKFTQKKKVGNADFTLGMIGVTPKMKRLDRALDLLEALLEKDKRYCLRIKGKNPLDYSWLLKREEELEYYQSLFSRINSNPLLRYKVIFDPPGDDVNDWFTLIGVILSPSDHESYHMAVGEGILTGTKPIIWNWEGASDIWGKENVVDDIEDSIEFVRNNAQSIRPNTSKAVIQNETILSMLSNFLK